MLQRQVVDFVILGHVNEENAIAIQGQKVENREYSGFDESDSFTLCYASFELLRHMLKISKQEQNHEDMTCLEIDNEKGKQSCHQSQPMEETTACHEMSNQKEGDEKDD